MGKRERINYPKFSDKFFRIDFEADPMPVLCLYPIPERIAPEQVSIEVCGFEQHPRRMGWEALARLPQVTLKAALICQLFNWSETVEWQGVRLVDLLDCLNIDTHPEGYYAVSSRDGMYFEAFSRDEARDPRVLLATGLNGEPLPEQHGGPVRLVVPFLQGYKSVKWVGAIKAYRHDPVGIKRLLGHSPTGQLNEVWRQRFGIVPPSGKAGDPPPLSIPSRLPAPVRNTTEVSAVQGSVEAVPHVAKTPWPHDVTPRGVLCEIIAIVRPERRLVTRHALEAVGVVAYSSYEVLGRSRQRGLRFSSGEGTGIVVKFLPKHLFWIVVEEQRVNAAVEALVKANRTGKGQYGDGRIFVLELAEAVRISTDERGETALR